MFFNAYTLVLIYIWYSYPEHKYNWTLYCINGITAFNLNFIEENYEVVFHNKRREEVGGHQK